MFMTYILILTLIPIVAVTLAVLLPYLRERRNYKKSTYGSASGNSFNKTVFDKGNMGEFSTYLELEKIGGYSKILVNTYIPKEDGGTTEIDLILIHQRGIYVIESKNYSGWIFGDEESRNWMQTFKNGYKQKFFNPIWQNNSHIRHLNNFLNNLDREFFKSVIVFSERCSIKKMKVVSENVKVVKRENLYNELNEMIDSSKTNLSIQEIDDIYSKLRPYILKSEEEKMKHINDIKTS